METSAPLPRAQDIESVLTPAHLFSPINSKTSEIRLLQIVRCERANPAGLIELDFEHKTISLNDPRIEEYVAISYECNAPVRPRDAIQIRLNGEVVPVKPNLQQFFIDVTFSEYPGESFLYWNDALCINMSDPTERAHQVDMMRAIYWSAFRVDAWLGPSTPEMETAIELFTPPFDRLQQVAKGLSLNDLGPAMSPEWKSAIHLLSQSYWRRRWTIQETVLAKSARAICGNSVLAFDAVREAGLSFAKLFLHAMLAEQIISTATYQQIKTFNERVSLADQLSGDEVEIDGMPYVGILKPLDQFSETLRVLQAFAGSTECFDERDVVYSIFGLLQNLGVQVWPADYTLSTQQVFIKTALDLVEKSRNLHILMWATGPPFREGLPSWVPDFGSASFGSPSYEMTSSMDDRGHKLKMRPTLSSGTMVLRCKAKILGRISKCTTYKELFSASMAEGLFRSLIFLAPHLTEDSSDSSESDESDDGSNTLADDYLERAVIDAFWMLFQGDRTLLMFELPPEPAYVPSGSIWDKQVLPKKLSAGPAVLDACWSMFEKYISLDLGDSSTEITGGSSDAQSNGSEAESDAFSDDDEDEDDSENAEEEESGSVSGEDDADSEDAESYVSSDVADLACSEAASDSSESDRESELEYIPLYTPKGPNDDEHHDDDDDDDIIVKGHSKGNPPVPPTQAEYASSADQPLPQTVADNDTTPVPDSKSTLPDTQRSPSAAANTADDDDDDDDDSSSNADWETTSASASTSNSTSDNAESALSSSTVDDDDNDAPSVSWELSASAEMAVRLLFFRSRDENLFQMALPTGKTAVGVCTAKAREDDVIALICGCPCAMVLRPAHRGRYQVIGTAAGGVFDADEGEGPFGDMDFEKIEIC